MRRRLIGSFLVGNIAIAVAALATHHEQLGLLACVLVACVSLIRVFCELAVLLLCLFAPPAHAQMIGGQSSTAWRARALSANGTNCASNQRPLGTDASGNAEACAAINMSTDVTGTLGLANGGTGGSLPSDCLSSNQPLTTSGGVMVCADVSPAITTAFAVHVDKNGADFSGCGPLNRPCLTLTSANGAQAQILAAHDNRFATCATNNTQGCGRCAGGSNNGTICNLNTDCNDGGSCTAKSCGDSPSTPCLTNAVCPSGGATTCLTTNNNSRCAGAACTGPIKTYAITLGIGRFDETVSSTCENGTNDGAYCEFPTDCAGGGTCTFRGTTAPIDSVQYIGSGTRTSTAIRSSSPCTFNRTNTINVTMANLQIVNGGSGDAICSTGYDNSGIIKDGATLTAGGWNFNFTGDGNQHSSVENMWAWNVTNDRLLHFQASTTHCSGIPTRNCLNDGNCTPGGGGTCTLPGSSDFTVGGGSFFQTSPVGSGDGALWYEAVACGIDFNLTIDDLRLQTSSIETTTKGVRLSQSSCEASSPYPNSLGVHVADVRTTLNPTPGGHSVDVPLDIGTNTKLVIEGLYSYDACKRIINGTLSYVSANNWNAGAGAYLGPLACAQPVVPQEGELWSSTTTTPPRFRRYTNGAVRDFLSVITATDITGQTGGQLLGYDGLAGVQLFDAPNFGIGGVQALRSQLRLSTPNRSVLTCTDTAPGLCTLAGDPTVALGVSTKQYVDNRVRTVRIPHAYTLEGDVTSRVPLSFSIPVPSGQTAQIVGADYQIESGTSVAFTVQRRPFGGAYANLTGFGPITVTQTEGSTTPSAISLADRDRLKIVLSSPTSTPTGMTVTLWVAYTF